MLIPPILEIFVVWHPDDEVGEQISRTLLEHFHGTAFSGLVGGAVEVYSRSQPWVDDSPRPLPYMSPLPNGLQAAALTVVVPVLGVNLLRAAENPEGGWYSYLHELAAGQSKQVLILPARSRSGAVDPTTRLGQLFADKQTLRSTGSGQGAELCRDLCHEISQFANGVESPLRVFLSHTKHNSAAEQPDQVGRLVDVARTVLSNTNLVTFYDATSLRPGQSWAPELEDAAANSAVLALRTDRYAGREWCQRELLVAKRADVPIVVVQALGAGEDRGSFLMDHVPSVSCPVDGSVESQTAKIEEAINKLVDEALKRSLWRQQEARLAAYGFDWLPANAPEPVTAAWWLRNRDGVDSTQPLQVLHPDPPLGPAEVDALSDVFALAGIDKKIDVLTPRTFATRGGQVR